VTITEQEISKNADKLIELGYKKWRKQRKQPLPEKKYPTQEDQLRDIEDSLIHKECT